MGKLRTALEALVKDIELTEKKVAELVEKLGSGEHNTSKLKLMGAEGIDMIYQYLEVKLKKQGMKIDDAKMQKTKIDDYNDSNVSSFLDGISKTRESALKARGDWESTANALDKCLKDLQASTASIDKMISAKKSKLIASDKFKQKVKIYEGWLSGLDKDISALSKRVVESKNLNEAPDPAQIKRVLDINADSTLADLSAAAGKGLKELIKSYEDVERKIDVTKRGVRDAGDFKQQRENITKWLKEAAQVDEVIEKKE